MSKGLLKLMVLKSLFEDVDGKELLQGLIESGVISKEQVEEYYNTNLKEQVEVSSKKQQKPIYSEIKDGVLVKFDKRDLDKNGGYATPKGVVAIGEKAFEQCIDLCKVHLSRDVVEIGSGAFDTCVYLESVTMTENMLKIGSRAFDGCVCLKNIKLSKNIKDIPMGVFIDCVRLEEIMLPEKVETIGDYAFGNCERLTTISTPTENLIWVHSNAFSGSPIKKDFMRKFREMQEAQKQEEVNTK